jgi:hypothetical protein
MNKQKFASIREIPSKSLNPTGETANRPLSPGNYHLGITAHSLLLLIIPVLYLATLARGLVLGDPTEYTFVAHILGIAHPPGYAFITLLGKLFQTVIPLGEIPWRMHLLSATAATLAALFVYGTVRLVAGRSERSLRGNVALPLIAALFAAFTVATAANFWQHAIHTNPHIITAAFLAANLYLLTRWWYEEQGKAQGAGGRWRISPLLLFAFSAGLGLTHHPLTVFGWPVYALFILWLRPSLLRQWRTLLTMLACALLGLAVWLYFPIRSPMQPAFGPHTMNTLDGFLSHVLARGLSDRLTFYGWSLQYHRFLVFWSLLRLQYTLPVIGLVPVGLAWLWQKRPDADMRPLWLLYGGAFLGFYFFVINLTEQDIMAYLLGPFLIVGLLAGFGLYGLLALVQERFQLATARPLLLLAGALLLLGPLLQISYNLPRLSLRNYSEGEAYVTAVFTWFDGRSEGAVLLNDWETMTPLWYTKFVEQRWPDAADVRPEFVSAAQPVIDFVYHYLPAGPLYLDRYRPEIVQAGFRLRPRGPFYQVVEPGESSLPPELRRLEPAAAAGAIEVVAYDLAPGPVTAGAIVPFTLAMRAPATTGDYYVPVVTVGELTFAFTTDSHLITPLWLPGEIIVERFDFALPHDLAGGAYPVTLDLKNLSQDRAGNLSLPLGELHVTGRRNPPATAHLLANFRQRVGLAGAQVFHGRRQRAAPWQEAISARPGDRLEIRLLWQSLAPAEHSYTVFVHLIDLANRPVVDDLDYTPLGGAAPTHLWIPKWLPGQRYYDPYRLHIPPDIAPGTYLLEVGLYEMREGRRLHMSDQAGNLVGDRYILGAVVVE